ncbi:MAG: hypothetical protein KJ787_02405 [Gammaproteobacteria bacterium]|nr:hypothetical protein [Gammaproteobacteria bacterium]MBU1645168.1 hypothetical protein [Gammaproteobacteria bacterium]MBU1973405.1 hypothetical protein [Gammaproteobacteria bacterium]
MKKSILAALVGAIVVSGVAQAAPADDVRALLEQKKPIEAYNLGRASPDQLGNPVFDFFYGIAAIDAGHAGEGVLALERYLLSFPDNRSARFQLARGYYVLGEDQRAREEFQQLLVDAAGTEKVAAERFLDAIKAREGRYTPTATGYLEAGLGYDTNINSGIPGGSSFSIPGGGTLVLSPLSVMAKSADSHTSLAGGVQGTYPVAAGVAAFGGLGFDGRFQHRNAYDQFNQVNLGGSGGISLLRDSNLYKVGLGYSGAYISAETQNYLTTASLFGDWQHQYDQFNRFSVGAQYAQLDYREVQVYTTLNKSGAKVRTEFPRPVRDSTFTALTAGWTRSFNMEYLPVLSLTANVGNEENSTGRKDLSRDIYGAKIGLSLTPAPKWGLAMGLGFQDNHYKATFVGGAAKRNDQMATLDMSLAYSYSRELTLRMEAAAMAQQSNVGLFNYDRYVVGLKARYDFK